METIKAPDVFESLHKQIDSLIETVEKHLRVTGDHTEDAASRAASAALKTARSLSHDALLRSRAVSNDVTRTIREHPMASAAALAAGIAALAGAISLATHQKADAT